MDRFALVVDDFYPDFGVVRGWADKAEFAHIMSPVDGVKYPFICSEVPHDIWWQTRKGVCAAMGLEGWQLDHKYTFARMSPHEAPQPHMIHTDSIMADWQVVVYLNRPEHCEHRGAGTALVRHWQTGAELNPTTPEEVAIWERDVNLPWTWEKTLWVGMKSNRAAIFRSNRYHMALPVKGFGHDNYDARMVLVMFFNLSGV